MVRIIKSPDDSVAKIAEALKEFDAEHPDSRCEVYRYNSGSIRVRIIDEIFADKDKGDRHDYAMSYFEALPEDVANQMSLLLCLAPGEDSLLDLEFRDPSPSTL